jgi:hypothetical protein
MRRRVSALLLGATLLAVPVPARADSVPFDDPAAVGTITLCDTRGHVVTHGDVRVKPFVWRAVGSRPAPAPYNAKGRTAALFGYQPIQNVDPSQWNGEYLTASGSYTNAQRPMAPATAADPTLADYLADYPPKWNGLVQLRLFLGVPQQPILTATYDAAVIRIDGNSWTLVSGGNSGCDSGTAKSAEMVLPSVAKLGTPAPDATTDVPTKAGNKAGSHTSTATKPASSVVSTDSAQGGPSAGDVTGSPTAAVEKAEGAGGSSVIWIVLACVAAAAAGAAGWWRLRSRAGHR